jgi:hypothetical protein
MGPLPALTFGFAMTILILFGAVLGFVTYENAALWAVTTLGGVAALTVLAIWMDELGGSDFHEPRRTYVSTSRQIVHIERPRERFGRTLDDEYD